MSVKLKKFRKIYLRMFIVIYVLTIVYLIFIHKSRLTDNYNIVQAETVKSLMKKINEDELVISLNSDTSEYYSKLQAVNSNHQYALFNFYSSLITVGKDKKAINYDNLNWINITTNGYDSDFSIEDYKDRTFYLFDLYSEKERKYKGYILILRLTTFDIE